MKFIENIFGKGKVSESNLNKYRNILEKHGVREKFEKYLQSKHDLGMKLIDNTGFTTAIKKQFREIFEMIYRRTH